MTNGQPLIVVTVGDRTPQGPYAAAIELAGGEPKVITPSMKFNDLPSEAEGLVLAGGASVEPWRYDSDVESGVSLTTDPARDRLEWTMLEQAIDRGIPVLGLCRGLQVINVYFGGELHQDLSRTPYYLKHRPDAPRDHLAHDVTATGGQLVEILGPDALRVNSIHYQGVKRLGDGLLATVHSTDGLIEGLETPDKQIMAVQWHPEELIRTDKASRALFGEFIEQVSVRI